MTSSRTFRSGVNTLSSRSFRPDYAPHMLAERLIAAGRFVLAFFSLIAVYLEPSTPARYPSATYTFLLLYSLYALGAMIAAWRSPVASARSRLVSHVGDLALFSLFIYLTEGPASPFFLYFVFSLFCATLRFRWRGILATGGAAMVAYGAMAVVSSFGEGELDISRVIVREVYLAVIAALLVYLGIYQERLRAELALLAAWPRELDSKIDESLRSSLSYAANVLRASRVILLWEEDEEPWVYCAAWDKGTFRVERFAPGEVAVTSDLAVQNASYLVRLDGKPTLVYEPPFSGIDERRGDPVDPAIREQFSVDAAIGVVLRSETLTMHLIVPGSNTATADDLALAHIAARFVLAALEQFFFLQQVRQTASTEERLRISRELHDGIVQSLGGLGLQLQAIRTTLPPSSNAEERLADVQRILEDDQRELRTIVRELRPYDPREGALILKQELQRMSERFPIEWGLEVELELPPTMQLSSPLAHEICRIVNESLSNAARHGSASRAVITITSADDTLALRVSDNGSGFPFEGRLELSQLEQNGSGPRTLRERVKRLGGSLAVDSSRSGAVIDARIPLMEASR